MLGKLKFALRDIQDCLRQHDQDIGFDQMAVGYGDPWLIAETDPETGYPSKEGVARARKFIARAENWTPFGWWLYSVWCRLGTIKTLIHCEVKGHDWQDESWGGSETGGMGASCQRCGFSWDHVLY